MPLIPMTSGSQLFVSLRGNLNGQRIINTFQYQHTGTADPAVDYRDYLDAFFVIWADAERMQEKFLDCMPSNYTLERTRLQLTFPVRLRYSDFVVGQPGLFANAAKTSNLAASIRRVTDVLGKRGVGRVQLPLPDDTYLEGKLSNADGYLDAAGILGVEMLEPIVTAGPVGTWEPVIFTVVGGISSTGVLIDALPEDTVRVMRRRTVRLGE